jgi:hypothetical protein
MHIPDGVAADLDDCAAVHWDSFYKSNADKFFRDRHYMHREFPLLCEPNITILEVCCTSVCAADVTRTTGSRKACIALTLHLCS